MVERTLYPMPVLYLPEGSFTGLSTLSKVSGESKGDTSAYPGGLLIFRRGRNVGALTRNLGLACKEFAVSKRDVH